MASPVVIDLGSGSCKAGEAAGSAPQLVVPSRVGRAKYGQGAMIGAHLRETWVGHEIEGKEAILIQKEPIHRGVVVNWDDLEHIFRHIFFNLHVDPAEHPVLLTEPALNPKANREKLIHSMFETFGVKRCSLFLQPVLALYSSGRTTGVILDCGDTVTCTVPIYDGFLIESGVQQLDFGGREITSYILKGLQERNDDCRLSTRMGFKIAENVKESLGFVQCDEVEEGEVSFELPSLESESVQKATAPLRVGAERHLGPEALFQPELQGKEQGGVVEMVWQSVMMADADIQDELLSSIVLCGGGLFRGFAARLAAGLRRKGRAAAVAVLESASTAAWRGGAMVATVEHRLWIDEKDYDEFGPTLVHERCF